MIVVFSYLAYLLISIGVTVWVARTLHRHGRIFLVDSFLGNEPLADSVNQLLVVGFYLMRHEEQPSELVVVSDAGEVYFNDAAWIVCLYALVDYRAWSFRLARPLLRGLARVAWETLSKNRASLSHLLALASDAELARKLEAEPAPAPSCAVEDGSIVRSGEVERHHGRATRAADFLQ